MTSKSQQGSLFRHAVRAGDLLFVSGQAATEGDRFVGGTFEEQFHRSVDNLEAVLKQEGLEPKDLVKVTAFVHDPSNAGRYNELYRERFAEPRPARTTLTGCLTDEVVFEIEAIAAYPTHRATAQGRNGS